MNKLPFIPNYVYKRRALHEQYGGNRQSGISSLKKHPWIFIFSGAAGKQHGYKDQWENRYIFSYTGEGQEGDMQFTRGNKALRDHLRYGKRVFLFEYVRTGFVQFITELSFLEADYFQTHDRSGALRVGIKFFFKRAGAHLDISVDQLNEGGNALRPAEIYDPSSPYAYFQPTERQGLVTSRVGQGAYRKSILHRWEYKCAVTQFEDIRVLIASHIVPWKDASDQERLDVENGMLLSPTYDALFDKHLITFTNAGRIVLSESIQPAAYHKIGVTGDERLSSSLSLGMLSYLEKHQDAFGITP